MASTPEVPVSPITAPTMNPALAIPPPSINATPVELDGTPTSAKKQDTVISPRSGGAARGSATFSPDADDEVYAELNGEKGVGAVERERRAQLLSSRSRDPAVIVDVPQTPQAEELETVAKATRQ
ncbi:hypothetical protein B0A49_06811 [Cryomyces minteri]|uniref:Uncharacterized protein n=1 Tax=Cryomyces minteri TaxID=331657 RepID=A0A4U0WSP7_9PEZI|nr:hypothetical protein B0A49_06811 [Cryomyces minteri]